MLATNNKQMLKSDHAKPTRRPMDGILATLSNPGHFSDTKKTCHFTLFITGNGKNSQIASKNLAKLCAGELAGVCTMEIVDILEDFASAVNHNILVTPTLLVTTLHKTTMITGKLSNLRKIRAALR
ncbi:KaiB domain-containing protein [Desulfonatronum thiosulfatophilum]|uniref:KaiB domain-containing protein n=1 Tax=Desulfonatronum thiosulfatophilum TaxID=617002 RepID=A0A1G6DKZ3_9BACT|nr:circadian clock KaiB family protein [Desulfonatronum thiosulfatophilum]SDB45771.1 KaiB domain-containing protein [Desulfonatronum thiosulfatophilum]